MNRRIPAAMFGALFIESSQGTEVHNLAVTGGDPDGGILVSGARDVLLDTIWVHDLPARAINAQATLGETSLEIRGSLIETAEMGMFLRVTFAAWYELPFFMSA